MPNVTIKLLLKQLKCFRQCHKNYKKKPSPKKARKYARRDTHPQDIHFKLDWCYLAETLPEDGKNIFTAENAAR